MNEFHIYFNFIIEFVSSQQSDDNDVAAINPNSDLELVCDQFGLNPMEFERCLTSRSFGVRSVVTCLFSVSQVRIDP